MTAVEAWLRAVVETPGLTSLDLAAARPMLVDDALRAVEIVRTFDGPVVDVGSGNGSPGIPIALALPDREVVLLEAEAKRCAFLRLWAPPNAEVVRGRAEEQETDWAGVALAKALAAPPVAAEWCLPLVKPGGAAKADPANPVSEPATDAVFKKSLRFTEVSSDMEYTPSR